MNWTKQQEIADKKQGLEMLKKYLKDKIKEVETAMDWAWAMNNDDHYIETLEKKISEYREMLYAIS